MKNTATQRGITHFTIVKILKKFSPVEINEFEKLICSPFFNNHSTIIKLFSELKKYYPHFTGTKVTKEYLFNVVNKGKKYDDKIFRKYFSLLNKLAEEYLNILQIRTEKDRKDLNILNQLSIRDHKEAYSRKLNEIEHSFKKEDKIDVDKFLLKHQLGSIKYNHKASGNQINPKNDDLLDSYRNLIKYFIFYSGSTLTQIETYKYSLTNRDEKNLLVFFDKIKLEDYITDIKKVNYPGNENRILFLEMVSNDIKMNSPKTGFTAYKNLRSLVYNNSNKLTRELLYFYLQRLNVFCIIQNVKGDRDMNRELFENYIMLLENGFYDKDGSTQLSLLDFRAVIYSALKNGEFEWCEKFIKDNLVLVQEESRKNIHHFGNSLLSFYKKKFDDSLEHISKIKFETLPITIDIYILKAKIFYALGYIKSALAVADSFRHYVSGSKLLSDYHKSTLLNFLKYFKALLRVRAGKDKQKMRRLLAELEIIADTREKKWMIGKVEELLIS